MRDSTLAAATPPLHGSIAIVTGAGSGIGRAAAMRLASAGAHVALLGRDAAALETVLREVEQAGGRATVAKADVTDRAAVDAAVAHIAGAGPPTLLVNNAGAGRSAPFERMTIDDWNAMLAVNLTGVFHVTQAVLPHMLAAGGGRVVNVASAAGLKGYPYIAAYAAAKHGVVGMTRALAVELAGRNITVNAVCPGYVDTPMTQATLKNIVKKTGRTPQAAREMIESFSPQKRLFDPDEVAATIVYLCSPDARGINGQAIPICGGELAV